MGQKVYPTGFRLGITENWRSRWFAEKDYAKTLGNDLEIRKYLEKRLSRAAVSRVEIERAGDKVKVIILTARPGVVIGKKVPRSIPSAPSSRRSLASPRASSPSTLSRSSAPSSTPTSLLSLSPSSSRAALPSVALCARLSSLPARPALRASVSSAPVVSAVPRWAVVSGTARVACLCTPSVPRSTTARCRQHHHGRLRREGLDLPGREAPGPACSQPCTRGLFPSSSS